MTTFEAVTRLDVSVTIVNWNGGDVLAACLRSVFSTTSALRFEVIVVDNGSDDDSARIVTQHFPQVTLIRNSTNLGFARAQNQAVARARARYVVMLNNDALVHRDTLPRLVEFMEQYPEVGASSCPDWRQSALGTAYSGAFRHFPSLGRTVAENVWAVLHPPRRWDLGWLSNRVHRWMGETLPRDDMTEVAWLVGALLCVRRRAMEEIGGFDEGFFLFDEDVDLCRRMGDAGWKVAFTTRTGFMHQGGVSSARRNDIEKIRGSSRARYFEKYNGRLTTFLFRLQHYILRICLLSWRRRVEAIGSGGTRYELEA